jgi:hypothetical protein
MAFQKLIIATTDTETCGLGKAMQVYDYGYVIHGKDGKTLVENHGLVEEIYTDAERMMGAYYAKKSFSHYPRMLDRNEISLKPWAQLQAEFAGHCEEFGVNVFSAYNAGFDMRAIKITNELLGKGKKFLPYNMRTLCLWEFACTTIFKSENYRALARQEGWVSDKGNFQTTAERAYQYLAPSWKFVEDHTALSDARIETFVSAKCFSRKKRVPWGEMGGSWQKAQPRND